MKEGYIMVENNVLLKKKVIVIIGTRPEATKMGTVIRELKKNEDVFDTLVVVTGQHKEQLYQALNAFDITPDIDLNIMKERQTLTYITAETLQKLDEVIINKQPDIILVHGDTQAALCGSLASYFHKIPLAHVEAGLRTDNKYSPWPEEMNRRVADSFSDLHLTPTLHSKKNLIKEAYSENTIFITGQTSVDAALLTFKDDYSFKIPLLNELDFQSNRILVATVHRRENYGQPMENIFNAMKELVDKYSDIIMVYPIHKNPIVREIARPILGNHPRIKLIEPLNYPDMINLLGRSYIIMTDSGGLQEEACVFSTPLVLLRDTTERPEAVAVNTVVLAGTVKNNIYNITNRLLGDEDAYEGMRNNINPYGDGLASERIVGVLKKYFGLSKNYPAEFS